MRQALSSRLGRAGTGLHRLRARTAPAPEAPEEAGPWGPAPVIEVRALRKTYGTGDAVVRALGGPPDPAGGEPAGVDLVVEQGDYVAVMGSSGSGKSTLMNILGCLDVPTSGRYLLDGIDVGGLDEHQLSLVRNRKIGFVFQSFNLVPRTPALAQVELPLAYAGVKAAERRRRALAALALVGLADRVDHRPNELSGGQQQRVAVARALVTAPAMLLADEPTGNLDSRSTEDVLAVIDRLNASGRTVVLITHEDEVARHAKRVLRLVDGRIVADVRQAAADGPPPALRDPAAFAGHAPTALSGTAGGALR
ncbi:ABC transporter ATP-binding protein [Actinacidiphila guanduensis]|jgi:putative ABC transport system ATP-binding protein|uniref:Putative ABC transport system ATP-binding protein n=1 Tax=Actinacidiphila guanduensis TaxID=310781 RepID=A0A1G9X9H8_9ACTN|nr:ABC transporter ATP-binding protein [Actinacidiphila guanduensis]SDM93388.1 putative ABC transport system ATP-binding protein [Actinacidiphila guanduensis]